MFKCFFVLGLFVCTDNLVDVKCVENALKGWERDVQLTPSLLNSVVEECDVDNRGCCSWHEGVNTCDNLTGKWTCNDGFFSSCYCGEPTHDHEM